MAMEYTRKVGGGAGPDGLPGAGPERTLAFGAVFLPRAEAKETGDKGAPAQDNVLPWPGACSSRGLAGSDGVSSCAAVAVPGNNSHPRTLHHAELNPVAWKGGT